jgi:AGCS family alanine or glycine:cation symporter
MNWLTFFNWLNDDILAIPTTILFFGIAIILTIKTCFLQFRGFPHFIKLITSGVRGKGKFDQAGEKRTINPFHALFASMSTSIGMGSVVGPSLAIMTGGPGALFWLVVYIFFGSVTKFTEVAFALDTRVQMPDGQVVGGPMQYLRAVSIFLANWYSVIMVFLFAGWSSLQSNTLATIYAQEGVSEWMIGLGLALLIWYTLQGGAQRVGLIASKLVPFMFCLYVTFSMVILFKDIHALSAAISLVITSIISPSAAIGGFVGTTVLHAMRSGVYQGVYITESGLGTASIAHAVADTKSPTDQGILAMYSGIADIILSIVSGMLTLVTGVWQYGIFRSTLIYEAFKLHAPTIGQYALLVSISLFVLTTVIGNSFNGTQSFASLTKDRWVLVYRLFVCIIIFFGALMPVPLVWAIMNTLLALVAIPNLIGLLILAFKKPHVIKC